MHAALQHRSLTMRWSPGKKRHRAVPRTVQRQRRVRSPVQRAMLRTFLHPATNSALPRPCSATTPYAVETYARVSAGSWAERQRCVDCPIQRRAPVLLPIQRRRVRSALETTASLGCILHAAGSWRRISEGTGHAALDAGCSGMSTLIRESDVLTALT